MLTLRIAERAEAACAMEIIDEAKAFLKAQGIDQWQTGYPDLARIQLDLELKKGYFAVDGERIVGYLCVDFDGEPAYEGLDGAWHTEAPYVVVHRMAMKQESRGRGCASAVFAAVADLARSRGVTAFRVDTDEANQIMKHLLSKNGFAYCGTICFDNSEKIAFDKCI